MKNFVKELCILHSIGVCGRPTKAPKIIELLWRSPSQSWIKINIDGAARGSPGVATFGGIFWDFTGHSLGCFAGSISLASSLDAELRVVIHVVSLAWYKGSPWAAMRQIEMKISTSFLVLPLCARVVHGECRIDSCKCKKNIVPIFGSLLSAVALLLVIVLILAWKLIRLRKLDREKRNKIPLASKKSQFTYDEVLEITENFQIDIGKGGFGIVYNGYLKDGTQVAVKIFSPLSSIEVELLPRIHHRNLTSLLGYSDDTNNLALKYGYMPNGNLKESLSDRKLAYDLGTETSDSIKYCVRLVLRVILYANTFADANTANILLSENLDAKIANFSLSMVFPNDNKIHVVASVMGTVGYIDPEYV
ncbi:probable LRR receptor-like serine/threonine-protein kinase At4g29180 [Pyrus x bretschneideri]|uniref:probable LRR receptor-like serine/threonine-protein kinase At4g29180 n=1 Tax=Pyrus x bretschneideri TaxID=225117 RepID=UPI00202FD215|nr:probable LRR receptor-like serine/threonine-protein kinase At4g29180 [Pyrus x bretschneideri]